MPVETPSLFARVIQDHLELKRRNAELEPAMPIDGYRIDDPFDNHPLFKTEEQARLEETMDGDEPAVQIEAARAGLARRKHRRGCCSPPTQSPRRTRASGRSRATSTGATILPPAALTCGAARAGLGDTPRRRLVRRSQRAAFTHAGDRLQCRWR